MPYRGGQWYTAPPGCPKCKRWSCQCKNIAKSIKNGHSIGNKTIKKLGKDEELFNCQVLNVTRLGGWRTKDYIVTCLDENNYSFGMKIHTKSEIEKFLQMGDSLSVHGKYKKDKPFEPYNIFNLSTGQEIKF